MGKPVYKKPSAGQWKVGRTFSCPLRSISLSVSLSQKSYLFFNMKSLNAPLYISPISILSGDNLWSPFWTWVPPWPKLPSSQVPSTASASPLGTGSSRLDRAAYPSLRQLEWLEVCVLAVTTTKWKDSLFLMTAFFFGGGTGLIIAIHSRSVLPIKLLCLHQGVSI